MYSSKTLICVQRLCRLEISGLFMCRISLRQVPLSIIESPVWIIECLLYTSPYDLNHMVNYNHIKKS